MQEAARGFIPAADEVNVVLWQRGADEREWFQKVGEKGHYGKPWQGIYAAAPSGAFLGSVNKRDPKAVADMLRKALEAYRAMDPSARLRPSTPARAAGGPGRLYPEGGLALQVFARDLPRADGSERAGFWANAWNSDYAWFTKEEVRDLLPAPLEAGARRAVPERLVRRLAKFHLLDNVRGETRPFDDGHVKRAELAFEVTGVEGDEVRLRIQGTSLAEEKTGELARGFESKILGRAAWSVKAATFVRFEMLAAGPRWGEASLTGARRDDLARQPIGIAFRLADGGDRIPPAHVIWGGAAKYFAK